MFSFVKPPTRRCERGGRADASACHVASGALRRRRRQHKVQVQNMVPVKSTKQKRVLPQDTSFANDVQQFWQEKTQILTLP
mmetsp:Transcript_31768/g.51589  ORF Transcript_31768/g.51589 Transcript_31768/m.51589 type:complete len:81 (-) Transcript_31768:1025-1267(-)